MRAVIVGAVESTEIAIAAFARSDWELALVVTLPMDKSARHSDYVDLQQAAGKAGAKVHRTTQTNHADTLAAIAAAKPDYIFVIGWSQICGPDFLNLVPGKVIGYHPAALPRLRGRAALAWTIILDEKITAGSLFWMDDGVDTGAILGQHFFHVAPRETAATLYAKHMIALGAMLDSALPRLAAGTAEPQMQDESCATYAARRIASDGLIDWQRPATEIDRLIRAAGKPYPGAYTMAKDAKLVIWEAMPYEGSLTYHARPGQIVGYEGDYMLVQTGDGLIMLTLWSWEHDSRPAMHSILGRSDG